MSIRVRSTRSADFSYPLQRHYSISTSVFLSLSPSDFRLVGSLFAKTDRVHPCPIDSIRRLFLPSAKTLLYLSVCFLSLSPSDIRLVESMRTLDDPTQFGCIGQPVLDNPNLDGINLIFTNFRFSKQIRTYKLALLFSLEKCYFR